MKKNMLISNKSRRKSFIYFGTVALLSFFSIGPAKTRKNMIKDEFIFVNGWILKKEDIYDL